MRRLMYFNEYENISFDKYLNQLPKPGSLAMITYFLGCPEFAALSDSFDFVHAPARQDMVDATFFATSMSKLSLSFTSKSTGAQWSLLLLTLVLLCFLQCLQMRTTE